MEEADRAGDDFGVQLNWPADTLGERTPPHRVDHLSDAHLTEGIDSPGNARPGPAPPLPYAGDEQLLRLSRALLAKTSDGLDEVLAELREQRRTHASASADARTSAVESTAAMHRLAAATVEISADFSGLVNAVRHVTAQQAAMFDAMARSAADVRALHGEMSQEVGLLRAQLLAMAEELGAVRRRLPISPRGGGPDAQRRTTVTEPDAESSSGSEPEVEAPAKRRRRP